MSRRERPVGPDGVPIMRRRPWWRRAVRSSGRVAVILLLGIPVMVVSAGAVGIGALVYGNLEGTIPSARPSKHYQPSRVFLMNPDGSKGDEIAEFRQFELTLPMQRADVPQVLKDAVVASEDRQFWAHRGVDPLGIARAGYTNFVEGETVQGGSTITQQLVRDRYLSQDRTVERKFNEVLLATRFERDLTDQVSKETGLTGDAAEHEAKERILFDYLNTTYFGSGAYGAAAASQTYFHKDVKDLTASEAAVLVAAIPAPSKYSPRDNITVAEQRRKDVLREMRDLNMLTPPAFDEAMASTLWYAGFGPAPGAQTVVYPPPPTTYKAFPYYVDYIRQYIQNKYGPDMLYHGGLDIVAAIDPRLQGLAEQAVGDTLSGTAPPLEMSLVSVEPSTGLVKAMVGGRDWNASQVNLALGPGYQAGSSFKAYTIATAFEQGYSDKTSYNAPGVLVLPGEGAIRGGAGGVIDLREATAQSVNTYFYQLARDVGAHNIAVLANSVGVTHIDPNRTDYSPRITFGQYEVSPLDMAAGYSVFANHGVKPGVTPVAKLYDADGKLIEDNSTPHGDRVLAASVADWTTEMLKGPVERGTASSAVHLGRPAAGKTGTTNDYKDAWFVGYVPQLATAVWMGHSDGPKTLNVKGINGVYGGSWPARTWNAYMKGAVQGLPVVPFASPGLLPLPSSGVRRVPDGANVAPELPRDCEGPCVATPNLTSPTTTTTAPPDQNGADCGDDCDSKGSP